VIYDLSGRRTLHPTKGVYIVNGKKIVFWYLYISKLVKTIKDVLCFEHIFIYVSYVMNNKLPSQNYVKSRNASMFDLYMITSNYLHQNSDYNYK
jgi:hypothetical protein